mmetsp:Transcript_24277/g.62580  ORF Transcript_24277/g.62580 Transcript_24277/m.62580 type:complete len:220 (+) Transcript_24277:1125-1784(+)
MRRRQSVRPWRPSQRFRSLSSAEPSPASARVSFLSLWAVSRRRHIGAEQREFRRRSPGPALSSRRTIPAALWPAGSGAALNGCARLAVTAHHRRRQAPVHHQWRERHHVSLASAPAESRSPLRWVAMPTHAGCGLGGVTDTLYTIMKHHSTRSAASLRRLLLTTHFRLAPRTGSGSAVSLCWIPPGSALLIWNYHLPTYPLTAAREREIPTVNHLPDLD